MRGDAVNASMSSFELEAFGPSSRESSAKFLVFGFYKIVYVCECGLY